MLVSLVILLTSLTVVVIEPRKIKTRTQCGEFLFVRIVERKHYLITWILITEIMHTNLILAVLLDNS